MAGIDFPRGAIITVVLPGEFGKPRPALVIQSDIFAELPTIVICPISSHLRDDAYPLRLYIDPRPENGLRKRSQILVDKITFVTPTRIGGKIGIADREIMDDVSRSLVVLLGIAA